MTRESLPRLLPTEPRGGCAPSDATRAVSALRRNDHRVSDERPATRSRVEAPRAALRESDSRGAGHVLASWRPMAEPDAMSAQPTRLTPRSRRLKMAPPEWTVAIVETTDPSGDRWAAALAILLEAGAGEEVASES